MTAISPLNILIKFRTAAGGPLATLTLRINLLALTASLTVTARLRGSALSVAAIR